MRIFATALATSAALALGLAACGGGSDGSPGGGATGGQGEPACGNGVCAGETCLTCPQDCGQCPATCGDDACNGAETCASCPHDCKQACSCGDGVCSNGLEDCSSCPSDCGPCPAGCPDGVCDAVAGETCVTCSPDCGYCPDVCGDGSCGWTEDCSSCAQDCGACTDCGNGVCEPGEDCNSCAFDCGACTWCGDGWCDWNEDCSICVADCGTCDSCGDGVCDWNEDCASCPFDCGECQDPCTDGTMDNDETDVDCGGSTCPTCPDGWSCLGASDCTSNACVDLVCFPCDSAKLAWDAPTSYSDGTCLPITDLQGFNVYWGMTSGGPYPNVVSLTVAEAGCYDTGTPDPAGCGTLWECTYTVQGLSNGTWYFSVSAVANGGTESELPPEVSKMFDCP